MLRAFREFWKDESGASAVEYALLLAMVSIGIVFAARTLSTQLYELIISTVSAVANAA